MPTYAYTAGNPIAVGASPGGAAGADGERASELVPTTVTSGGVELWRVPSNKTNEKQ